MPREKKFTPGPWEKDYGGSVGHIKSLWEGHKVLPGGRATPTVCKYEMHPFIIPEEEQEANAHLIKTAPKLLDALEGIMHYAKIGAMVSGVYTDEQHQFVAAYKAIKEAYGE